MSEEITPYQVVPKTPLAGSAAADIREQGEISRRSFPFVLTLAWVSLTAALGGLASVLGRFMFPNVLFEPVQKFKAGQMADYAVGEEKTWLTSKHSPTASSTRRSGSPSSGSESPTPIANASWPSSDLSFFICIRSKSAAQAYA